MVGSSSATRMYRREVSEGTKVLIGGLAPSTRAKRRPCRMRHSSIAGYRNELTPPAVRRLDRRPDQLGQLIIVEGLLQNRDDRVAEPHPRQAGRRVGRHE